MSAAVPVLVALLLATFAGILLQRYSPAFALLLSLGAAVWLLLRLAQPLRGVLQALVQLGQRTNAQAFSCLLRSAGILLLADYVRTLCEEAGADTLAWCAGLAGRCLVLAAVWPLLEQIFQTIQLGGSSQSTIKADSDSLQLAQIHSAQEVISGFEGTPIPYSPRTDDAIALTLLACFFLSSIALARGKKFLSQQVKDFVLHRERTSIFDSSTAADMRYLLVLVVQTCVLSGITFFNYFHDTSPALMNSVSPLLLLGIYVGSCLAYFLLKWLLYMFIGWTFFDKNRTNIWLESYSTLIYYAGFALFPFVLFLVYFDLSLTNLLIIGTIILIFAKILMFYKWIKLFFHQFGALFLLILYFCALEILPCLLLYQGMIQINNILLIKF